MNPVDRPRLSTLTPAERAHAWRGHTTRELRQALGRVQTALETLTHVCNDSRSVQVAVHNLRAVEEELEAEIGLRAVPQRARRTRNGTARELAEAKRIIRGIHPQQLDLTGAEAVDRVAAELRSKGIAPPRKQLR